MGQTPENVIAEQHASIIQAIEILQHHRDLIEHTNPTDANWQTVSKFASVCDQANTIINWDRECS